MGYSICIVAIFGHFQKLKCSHFSNISCFFDPFYAQKNFHLFLEIFFACFRQFYFLIQSEYFACALRPFLAIFEILSFFEYQHFFGGAFCIEQLQCVCTNGFCMSQTILFFDRNEYFARAITLVLWPFLVIFKTKCSHFSNISCFLEPFFCIEQV